MWFRKKCCFIIRDNHKNTKLKKNHNIYDMITTSSVVNEYDCEICKIIKGQKQVVCMIKSIFVVLWP